MHHFFEAITNTAGQSLIGYFARVINPTTQMQVALASDDAGTPIQVVSGVANMAKTDEFGNLSLYVTPGTYNLDIYGPDATSFLFSVKNIAMNSSKGDPGDPGLQGPPGEADNTYTTLAAFKASDIARKTASLVGVSGVADGRFNWTPGNFAGQDDDKIVVKADGTSLAVGAWVRQDALIPNLVRDGRDNTAVFQQLLNVNSGKALTVPAGDVIRVAATVTIPQGTSLLLPQGRAVLWTGPASDGAGGSIGVFKMSNDSSISVNGPEGAVAIVEAATDMHAVYAVLVRSTNNLRVTGIMGVRIAHLDANAVTSSGTIASYADAVTPQMKQAGDSRAVNICSNIKIYGGGCRFDNMLVGNNFAGVGLAFVQGAEVVGCRWTNAGHGCVSAGGNAAGIANGAVGNERKAKDIFVTRCFASYSSVGGIWGAMTENLRVSDCEVAYCEDVGFDSEGNTNSVFQGNKATDCKGGNYTTFYLNQNILFQNNASVVSLNARPHFKIYNDTLTADNGEITWDGGNFVTLDPTGYGTVSADSGPCRFYTVKNATFTNTVLRVDKLNLNQVRLQNNRFYYTYRSAAAFNAIRVAGLKSTPSAPARAFAIISDNNILSEVVQPSGSYSISLSLGDDNIASLGVVKNNDVLMPLDSGPVPILLEHVGANSGTSSRFGAYHNRQLGQILTRSTNPAALGIFDADGNRTENGVVIGLTAI